MSTESTSSFRPPQSSTGTFPPPRSSTSSSSLSRSSTTTGSTGSMGTGDLSVTVSPGTSTPPKPDSLKKDMDKDKQEPKISKRAQTIGLILGGVLIGASFLLMMSSLALGPYCPLLMVPAAILLIGVFAYVSECTSSEKDDNMLNKAGVKLDNLFSRIGSKLSGKSETEDTDEDDEVDDAHDVQSQRRPNSSTIDFDAVEDDDDLDDDIDDETVYTPKLVRGQRDDDDDEESDFDLSTRSSSYDSLPGTSTSTFSQDSLPDIPKFPKGHKPQLGESHEAPF